MAFVPVPAKKCEVCEKTVYEMEKVVVESRFFHKQCFRCSECNRTMTPGTYASMKGRFWCKPCFKTLFRLSGNYSDSFGEARPTAKWDALPAQPEAAEGTEKTGTELEVGQRVHVPLGDGVIRHVSVWLCHDMHCQIGPTEFASGVWVGVELDTPTGKNDGSVKGERYFECEALHGSFVREDKVTAV